MGPPLSPILSCDYQILKSFASIKDVEGGSGKCIMTTRTQRWARAQRGDAPYSSFQVFGTRSSDCDGEWQSGKMVERE